MFPVMSAGNPITGYNINNSLRFRNSASAYLNRTPVSSGNSRTFTWSGWVKRGSIATSVQPLFFSEPGSNGSGFYFSQNTLQWYNFVGATDYGNATTAVFRDPSAWYHIVLAIDTTQATASNRAKVYINGVAQTFTQNYGDMPQNFDTSINTTSSHLIGRETSLVGTTFDGYMTEVNFVDGQALTPSSFGSTDAITGQWLPKQYSGTYGTNGFYLKFSDISTTSGSNAGLGKDFSGNGNYWTTNNISVTAGTTYDAMIDSPTLTSATVGNYCVLNPIQNLYSYTTFSNANLTVSHVNNTSEVTRGSFSVSSGKWYFEATVGTTTGVMIGITNDTVQGTALTSLQYLYGYTASNSWSNGGFLTYGASFTTGDIIGVALDMDAGTLTFYKNNTSQGSFVTGLTGSYQPAFSRATATPSASFNFGQRPFSYTPPTGFVALNTYNLPTPTIKAGNKYMDATTYTGTGATATITNAAGFKTDFVWIKCRSGIQDNTLFDSVRGTTKYIISNSTAAETTDATTLTAFNSNGWTMGSFNQINNNASTYVGWQWQAGQGSSSSNTSGSITSTVSANTTAGFSIVTYTGTGANATVGHGLGVAPKMVIVKNRNAATEDWRVYHVSIGATNYLNLNGTIASSAASTVWNNTTPTSTVFSIGTNASVSGNTQNIVAYCWAEIAGFSKFGSYTGNGSTDGTFIYLGFRPKFVMIKRYDAGAESWTILDTSVNTYNLTYLQLFPNSTNAEVNGSGRSPSVQFDYLSNGFKLRGANGEVNGSGWSYIYAAFAENPFKNANAR
jgi:hypothetical protein